MEQPQTLPRGVLHPDSPPESEVVFTLKAVHLRCSFPDIPVHTLKTLVPRVWWKAQPARVESQHTLASGSGHRTEQSSRQTQSLLKYRLYKANHPVNFWQALQEMKESWAASILLGIPPPAAEESGEGGEKMAGGRNVRKTGSSPIHVY